MKVLKCFILFAFLSYYFNGCLPVLVGGLIYKSVSSEEEKAEFLKQLQKTNIAREKNGLKPLDKCIEIYHFDPGWAEELKDCERTLDSLMKANVKSKSGYKPEN